MSFEAPVQRRSGEVRIVGWRPSRQSSSGSNVCRRNATTIASSSRVRTVERGSFGPISASAVVDLCATSEPSSGYAVALGESPHALLT